MPPTARCPHCGQTTLSPTGATHTDTDGRELSTWACPCGYSEGRPLEPPTTPEG